MDRVIEHRCTACIGVVVFLSHEVNPEDLLKWADIAMYQAKDAGRNSVRFHKAHPEIHAKYVATVDIPIATVQFRYKNLSSSSDVHERANGIANQLVQEL